jgi:hypothetical protein
MKKNHYTTILEVHAQLGLKYQQVYYAIQTGKVKVRKVGRQYMLTPKNVEELKKHFKIEEATK